MAKRKRPEDVLRDRVASYLRTDHPDIIFRFDLFADTPLPIGKAKLNKQLHGKFSRGFPDLVVYGTKGAFFLELKDRKIIKSEHTDRQKAVHAILRQLGFKVSFIISYEDAVAFIERNI